MATPTDSDDVEPIRVPSTSAALAWLREVDDPVVALRLAIDVDQSGASHVFRARCAVLESPPIAAAFDRQRRDGSWGDHPSPTRRILPTLRAAQTLADLGATDDRWTRAAEFLAANAHTDGGVFSIDGRRDGVLSCYVGMAATAYQLAGLDELARPQLRWIRDHQAVQRRGRSLRHDPPQQWGEYLRHRYGGCMSETTCLIGLVKTGRALQLERADGRSERSDQLVAAIRAAFLERRLVEAADGSTVPIGRPRSDPDAWLDPTFPLDWHTDLIEVVDFVARTGPADHRMQRALDVLARFQLADGTWPLRRAFWPDDYRVRARRSRTRGDPMTTLRAVLALRALSGADPATAR